MNEGESTNMSKLMKDQLLLGSFTLILLKSSKIAWLLYKSVYK
jgi:hypothetical protein